MQPDVLRVKALFFGDGIFYLLPEHVTGPGPYDASNQHSDDRSARNEIADA